MGRPSGWEVVDLAADPTPGESWGVSALAHGYQRIADDAESSRALVSRVQTASAGGDWLGEAGNAFRAKLDGFPEEIAQCADSFQLAADALTGWSARMSEHQSTADSNLIRAQHAREDLDVAAARLVEAEAAAAEVMAHLEAQQSLYDRYGHAAEPPDWVRVPTAGEMSRLRAEQVAAGDGVSAHRTSVADAQSRLDAAKRLVCEAKEAYEGDAESVAARIESAADAGIRADSWWERLRHSELWQALVVIATVVVVILAIVAIVFTGPVAIIAAVAGLLLGAVLLADDVMAYADGDMSDGEFATAIAMSIIPVPGAKGVAKGARQLWKRSGASLRGLSEGGIGIWLACPKRTKGVEYQEFITGVERGTEYKVGDVWFDGYDASRGVLLDAKDWRGYPPPGETFWHSGVIEEIRNQRAAAGDVPIEWHFSTLENKQMADMFIEKNGDLVGKVTTIHTPFIPEP